MVFGAAGAKLKEVKKALVVGLVCEGPFKVHAYVSFFNVKKLTDNRYDSLTDEVDRVKLLQECIVVVSLGLFTDGHFGAAAWRQLGAIAETVHTALMGSEAMRDAANSVFSRLPEVRDTSFSKAPGVTSSSGVSSCCLPHGLKLLKHV